MCITLPGRVIKVKGSLAEIEYNHSNRLVKIGSQDKLSAGDWVLFTSDYLIKKINYQEAQEIFDLLGVYKNNLPETNNQKLKEILLKSREQSINLKEIKFLLSLDDNSDLQTLFIQANLTRRQSIKDHICIHGIIEFSNYCKNNCWYCGLRCQRKINRYRLTQKEIVETAVEAVNRGYKILVLQSGEDDYYTQNKIIKIIKSIKEQVRVFIYLSIGDRSREDYLAFKKAGANGVLYRFETSNSQLYSQLRPGHKLNQRLNNLKMLQKLNYIISTGMIIGLPNQTLEDLAKDILLMKKLNTFMPSFGPLIPTQETPLAKITPVKPELILKIIAITRLIMPQARLPVTTAMETLMGGKTSRKQCFFAGANALMLNLTPVKYRKDYCIYDNKFFDADKNYETWGLFQGDLSYEMLQQELGFTI